jgi:hypothetical protein
MMMEMYISMESNVYQIFCGLIFKLSQILLYQLCELIVFKVDMTTLQVILLHQYITRFRS